MYCAKLVAFVSVWQADREWKTELSRLYGSDAYEARFDYRGTLTQRLMQLHQNLVTAKEICRSTYAQEQDSKEGNANGGS